MAPTTGFEDTSGASWTTLTEEQTFLETIVAETGAVLTEAGQSVEGRSIWRLDLGDASSDHTLMLTGGVHGNEQAGREAVLQFVRDLAYSVDAGIVAYLASVRVVALPTVNPDGILADTRANANGVDVNQDMVLLSQPEGRVVHTVRNATGARLVHDAHESIVGIDPSNDVEYRRSETVEAAQPIRDLGDDLIAALQAELDVQTIAHGFFSAPRRVSVRETAALNHVLGLTVETNRTDDTASGRTSRVSWHVVALGVTRQWHGDNLTALATMETESRLHQATTTETYVLQTGTTDFPWPQTLLPATLTGYEMSTTLSSVHRDAFGITVSGSQVALSQEARAAIPILVDEGSDDQVVSSTRILLPVGSSAVPQVAQAVVRTRVTWLACDLVTGRKLLELPDAQAAVERVISAYTSADVEVPAPLGGPGALAYELLVAATEPDRTLLVLVVNDVPTWGGRVRDRVRGTDAMWHLPCTTLESYLDARRVRDHVFTNADLGSVIGATVASDAGDLAGVGSGIGLVIDAPATGILRDRAYKASDRQSVYDALRELAGVGIEWTVDLDWQDAERRQVVTKIIRLRTRIGIASAMPRARFDTRSESETQYRLSEDHTTGRYANYVIAYSPGEGEDQIASDPAIDQAALDSGVPIIELHWQPSSSIIDKSVLDEHAARRLAEVRNGSQVWELTARWDRYPRLNVDWALGDDIAWQVVGHGHPSGVSGIGRAIGWSLDTATGLVSPRLLDPTSDPEA